MYIYIYILRSNSINRRIEKFSTTSFAFQKPRAKNDSNENRTREERNISKYLPSPLALSSLDRRPEVKRRQIEKVSCRKISKFKRNKCQDLECNFSEAAILLCRRPIVSSLPYEENLRRDLWRHHHLERFMERMDAPRPYRPISGETIEIDVRPGFQGNRNSVCDTHALRENLGHEEESRKYEKVVADTISLSSLRSLKYRFSFSFFFFFLSPPPLSSLFVFGII